MNNLNCRSIQAAISAAVFLMGASSASNAADRGAVQALSATQRVGDLSLPPQAKAGTGVAGTFNPLALGAATVSFALPDGRVLEAERQRTAEDRAKGRKSWVGTFESQPGSVVVITTHRGVTTGFVTYGTETWELIPGKSGGHVLYRVDDTKLPTDEPLAYPPEGVDDTLSDGDYGTGGATADAAGGYVHNLLVVYTPKSRNLYGQAALEGMVINAVQAANQAYLNSRISITLNLVGMQETAYTESGSTRTSLAELQASGDGKLDEVHRLRDNLAADVVALITEDTNACGTAYTMQGENAWHASYAFGVVKSGCLSGHSLAHEIGHVQGNQHDRANSTNTGAFAYSYGYRLCSLTDGTGFRTVMSYSCSGAPRVTQFSNPSITYNGHPTGVAYESSPSTSADNARSMNNTADTVAVFRGSSSSGTTAPSTVPAAPSSVSATATSYSSVAVKWADNSSNETGFKVERSTDGVTFAEIATVSAGATGYNDNGRSALSTYYYRVRAFSSAGNSAYSNVGSVRTPDLPPAAPASVVASNNSDGSASVNWVDSSANETGFEVVREKWDTKRSQWSGATKVGTAPSGVSSMVDLSGPGTFRYSVRAVNAGGASSYVGPAQTTVSGGTTVFKAKGRNK